MTYQRRSKGNAGTTVTFTADTPVTMKKEQFLANRQNKQCFIFMLSEELKKNNCEVHHASGNADLLIVMKAVVMFYRGCRRHKQTFKREEYRFTFQHLFGRNS